MGEPEQVPIWIGPAQELDSANACSLLWPADPFSKCPAPLATVKWTNITLRNINIINPKESPGLIYGNATSPMVNVTFNNVKCTPKDDTKSFAENYKKSEFYDGMDDVNKKAMDVWAEKGAEAAVKHMFTDQETGRTLSYGEMRSLYG